MYLSITFLTCLKEYRSQWLEKAALYCNIIIDSLRSLDDLGPVTKFQSNLSIRIVVGEKLGSFVLINTIAT